MPSIVSGIYRDTPYWLNLIYDGRMYEMSHRLSIAAGGTADIQFKTPTFTEPGWLVHIVSRYTAFASGGPITIQYLEAPTVTDGTAPPDVVANLDRRNPASAIPKSQIFVNPTGISGGELIDKETLFGGGGGPITPTAAVTQPVLEWVLKPDTDYVIRLNNEGGSTSSVYFMMTFYESRN